jgi:type II secretory pathway pseudopilin PulG
MMVKFIKNKAFTLVELIMVITISVFLGASVLLSLASGLNIFKRSRNLDIKDSILEMELDEMSSSLRQASLSRYAAFNGEQDSLSFVALINQQPMVLNYNFNPASRKVKEIQIPLDFIVENKTSQANSVRTALTAEEFSFEYLRCEQFNSTCSWDKVWQKDKQLPAAVRISVSFKGKEYSRVVFIPVGQAL